MAYPRRILFAYRLARPSLWITVKQICDRRAVSNQAMGMLMLQYGVNADLAFKLLTRLSQESNIKLRVIAERAVADPATLGGLVDNVADRIDTPLRSGREGSN